MAKKMITTVTDNRKPNETMAAIAKEFQKSVRGDGRKERFCIGRFSELKAAIVSDDACVGGYLAARLTRLGIRCTLPGEAGQTWELFEKSLMPENGYGICFVDLGMNREAGPETAGRLKNLYRNKTLPVVGIVDKGRSGPETATECGVDNLLERPILQENVCRLLSDLYV